LKHCSFTR